MLPSQGLFRSIPCPFFLAGLCERPHCSFRHCRSDIRIDRKLESDSIGEPNVEEETTEAKGIEKRRSSSNNETPLHEPVIVEPTSNSNCSSKSEPISKESEPERLNTPQDAEVQNSPEPTRKRSRDSETKETNKRRRISTEANEMGELVSKVKNSLAPGVFSCTAKSDSSSTGSGSKKRDKDDDDLDKIVEEIEKSGKSSSDSHHSKSKKSHHKHRHKHSSKSKDSDVSGSSDSASKDTSGSSRSSSDRKENRSNSDRHRKRSSDDRKDKDGDRKDSRKEYSRHTPDDKRRNPSIESSVSSSHSPKDHKRARKSSESEDGKRSDKSHRHHSSSDSKKRERSNSSSPRKEDRRNSKGSHEKSSDLAKDTLKSIPPSNSIDTTNRFNALAESSTEESAYNSDVFDDSLEFKYPDGSDSEDDPEMIAKECLEMFENYKPEVVEKPSSGSNGTEISKAKDEELDEGFCVVGKKRVAHSNAIMKAPSAPVPAPRAAPATVKNLQDQLLRRFDDQTKNRPSVQNGTPMAAPTIPPPSPKPGKMRIAHVPNAGKLAQKPVIGASIGKQSATPGQKLPGQPGSLTYSQTAAKGVKREAHKSSSNVVSKPGPMVFRDAINKSTKIPHLTRQQIIDKMFAEYLRILENHDEAFQTTIKKEDELIGKCSSKQVYYNCGISVISGLRKASKQSTGQSGSNPVVSHEHILTGGSLESRNCSVRTVKKDGTLPTGNSLYRALQKYIMTEQQLVDNGYPRPHPSGEPGRAMAKPRQGDEKNGMTLTRRVCDRCKKTYATTEDGDAIVSEVCNYHWGRKFNTMTRAGRGCREANYVCCGSDDDKIGCMTAICHVSKCPIPLSSQKGFVEAVLEEGSEDRLGNDPWDIIGIDCEMVYTTHGNELARVTIVGVDRKVLYDEIVKPTHKVLDCNSRFSGITFDDMDKAKRTITDIQAIILTRLRPNTIIIGHSLESDLIALRLKHECVIDTSVLYPHRLGPPKKRALKTLSAEILKKVIQESDSGHDSAEDAQIAVELVMAKLKSDITK